jgi:hypothetical protein
MKGILTKVSNLRDVLYDESQRLQCPEFKAMLDWIGTSAGVSAY